MNVRKLFKTPVLALLGLALLAIPAVADTASNCAACDLSGVTLTASGEDVTVYFVGQTAGYDSYVSLSAPFMSAPLLYNHVNSPGDSVFVGTFSPGTVLTFQLTVYNPTDVPPWFTGPGSLNADLLVHAGVKHWDGTGTIPEGTFVGFEDLVGGGDRDYDDHMFVFTNTRRGGEVPEPASLFLLGTGLLGAARRGRKWLDR